MNREFSDVKQPLDDYDVTLLIAHDLVNDDPLKLSLKYYVILSSKRDVHPRLVAERRPGKFLTVSTGAPVSYTPIPSSVIKCNFNQFVC